MKRLKPLNTLLYIKNNPRKIIPNSLAVALGVFLIYFISMLGGGISYQLDSNIVKPYNTFSSIYFKDDTADMNTAYNYFKNNKNTDKIIFYTGSGNFMTSKMIVDSCGAYCLWTDSDSIKYLMKKFNFKISNGRLPENKDEIIFNEKLAKQINIKVGDYYGTDVNSKHKISGKYKVTGTYNSDMLMTFACISSSEKEAQKASCGFLVVPKDGKMNELNSDIHKFVKDNSKFDCDDYNSQMRFISQMLSMFNVFAVIILGITVFVISFTIGDINYVHFSERLPEFSMLEAIGLSMSEIKKRQLLETICTIFIGFIIGFIFSILSGNIFNQIYCVPKGIVINVVNKWYIILSVLVPVLVSVFACISVIKRVNKMQLVDVLEGKV